MSDKRLVTAFKGFVEKNFLAGIKRTDPQALEWNKFNRLISAENPNYEQIAAYLDGMGNANGPSSFQSTFDKKDLPFMRSKRGAEEPSPPQNGEMGFNPSKTFGGERARMMFMKGEEDDSVKRGFSSQQNAQALLPGLEKLSKVFLENQQRIESMLGESKSPNKLY